MRVGCGSCELEEGLGMDGKWNMCFHGYKGCLVYWGLKHYVRGVLEVSTPRDLFWDKNEGWVWDL